MDKKFLNYIKNKKVGFILLIGLLIFDGAVIITSFGGDITIFEPENVTFSITDIDCHTVDLPNNKSDYYVLSSTITIDQCPSNLDGYYIKQSFYDKNNKLIGSKTESLSVYSPYADGEFYSGVPQYLDFVDVYKKPNPDHVSIEIIKKGKIINNSTYKINPNQINFK